MLQKLFHYAWSIRKQFINYFITGFSGTFIDLGTFYLFNSVWHWRPVCAVVLNQLIILSYVFLLNKYWTFKARGMAHRQVARFFILFVFNYSFAIIWMWFWGEWLNYNANWVRLCNIILAVSWNFFIYKYWVYKE